MRAYGTKVVVETRMSGRLDKASSAGFRLIADYIFGNNASRTSNSEEINLTAPVSIDHTSEQWRVQFVMPGQYILVTLPKLNNPVVTLREVPKSTYTMI